MSDAVETTPVDTAAAAQPLPAKKLPSEWEWATQGMERSTFYQFRDLVYVQCGIALSDSKEALVRARIAKRMRSLGLSSHRDYLQYVKDEPSGTEMVQFLDSIATNVTDFFREPEHFTFLDAIMHTWLLEGKTRFRFWSAACSSGEEPYSMAMTLHNACEGVPVDVRILATDISTKALSCAQSAEYGSKKVEKVPAHLRKYLIPHSNSKHKNWTVLPDIKRMVAVARMNLIQTPYPMQGPFDAIFCRNVMIYFDAPVRHILLREFLRLIRPGGYLFVGHAESLTGMQSPLRPAAPAIYYRP